MTAGHYTILWHPYDPERYAELHRKCRTKGFDTFVEEEMAEYHEYFAMLATAGATPPWEDELDLLDLAHCEALLAAVQARVEQLRP